MRSILLISAAAAMVAAVAHAELPEEYAFVQELFPGTEVTNVKTSPVEGLLEVNVGADTYYLSRDGKYFVQGEIYDLDTRENITEQSRAQARASYLQGLDYDSAITFAAAEETGRVLIFTDIDCGYCRKLHRQIEEYNARGITVQYMFFPRSGPNTDSWAKAERVWCAESQREALTAAKLDQPFSEATCEPTPVAEHYQMGKNLGLMGTPAIFLESGELVPGYRTPDELEGLVTGTDEDAEES